MTLGKAPDCGEKKECLMARRVLIGRLAVGRKEMIGLGNDEPGTVVRQTYGEPLAC